MIAISIRTDAPDAEIGVWENAKLIDSEQWRAHRELAETIHIQLQKLLTKTHHTWSDIEAIICYKGPGSFTGLRIGLTVGNALAYSLGIPIVGTNTEHWISQGFDRLTSGDADQYALPAYGEAVHLSEPKH